MLSSQVKDLVTGKSVDEVIVELGEAAKELKGSHLIRSYNSFESLGLPRTSSISELCDRVPANSIFMCNVYDTINTGLSLPVKSGNLLVRKDFDKKKAYVIYENEYASFKLSYNKYVSPAVSSWRGDGGHIGGAISSDYQNKVSGIKMCNVNIYFNSGQAANLTDKPTEIEAGGLFVSKERYGAGENYLVTLTKNSTGLERWIRREEGGVALDWIKVN